MQRALGMGIFTFLVAEVLFNWIAFGAGAMLAGLIVGYIIGSFFLGGRAGPFSTPWLVVKDFRILDRLQQRAELILRVQHGHEKVISPDTMAPADGDSIPKAKNEPPNPPPDSNNVADDEAEFDPNTPTFL